MVLGLHGVVTSSPARRGERCPFVPDVDEPNDDIIGDEPSTFEYFRPLREPYNRISDTHTRTIFLLSNSRINEANPRPLNWRERPIMIVKYVDDFLGAEKMCLVLQ